MKVRARTPAGWGDASILNLSTRGLLIYCRAAAAEGETIELRHKDRAIRARVVWREGPRVGLCAEQSIAVEDLLLVAASPAPVAPRPSGGERRRTPRTFEESQRRARALQFASVLVIASSLCVGVAAAAAEALARPLGIIGAALGGG